MKTAVQPFFSLRVSEVGDVFLEIRLKIFIVIFLELGRDLRLLAVVLRGFGRPLVCPRIIFVGSPAQHPPSKAGNVTDYKFSLAVTDPPYGSSCSRTTRTTMTTTTKCTAFPFGKRGKDSANERLHT